MKMFFSRLIEMYTKGNTFNIIIHYGVDILKVMTYAKFPGVEASSLKEEIKLNSISIIAVVILFNIMWAF